MNRFLLLFIILLFTQTALFAQSNGSINGYITDSQTGETLIAANIALLETNRGTSSNTSGYYSITNIEPGTYTLIATFIGYQRFEREISLSEGENLRLNIELVPEGIQLQELVVESTAEREEQRNIGRAQVSTELIKEVPSIIEPDVFRSVQLLPGVKAASDFSSGLYIRGGGPDQTLILLDETTVYNPSHFFGFFSTFNPDAVKDVRLYKGGYPAEYGGRLGSVLTVFNKDGNRNETTGTVSLGLLASRASVEGPYSRGSWMLAVRRSTLEPVLAVLRQSVDTVPDKFYFYDINGKINFDATDDDRFSLALYSGNDSVSLPFQEDAQIRLNYGNQTISGKWRRILSDRLFGSATVTGSRYFNQPGFEIGGTPFESDNKIYDFSLKSDLEYLINDRNTLSAGIWSGILTLKYADRFDNQSTFTNRIQSTYLSAYLQNEWRPSDRWKINGGIRLNSFSEGNFHRLEPRFSIEHRPFSNLRIQTAYGRYYQYLTLITNEAFSGFDIWLTSDDGVPPSFGDQFVLGFKTIPFDGYGFDVEFYFRTMRDLFELDPFVSDAAGLDYTDLFRFGEGYAYGIELFLEKQRGRFTGFMGYTFGITQRKFPGFNTEILDNPERGRFYPPKYDRKHDANIVATYQISDRWSFSTVFNFASGQPYTEPLGRTQLNGVPWGSAERDIFTVGKVNASRLPSYHRLDFSFSREGRFFNLGDAEWQFQVINAYSRRNIWFYNYDFDENPVERQDVQLLPIIPSISYTVNF
ncbi:TonB-dependent receptor [Rhodohalobacter halophilus]|uniref:TonB-dependent receptor n=1 Tax=Rhodohalobacter halophilus TaxID=1812810 RepID=UPI00083FCA5D|nr:TonB-dependent receptor [Rhodohalobacter halophilus]